MVDYPILAALAASSYELLAALWRPHGGLMSGLGGPNGGLGGPGGPGGLGGLAS